MCSSCVCMFVCLSVFMSVCAQGITISSCRICTKLTIYSIDIVPCQKWLSSGHRRQGIWIHGKSKLLLTDNSPAAGRDRGRELNCNIAIKFKTFKRQCQSKVSGRSSSSLPSAQHKGLDFYGPNFFRTCLWLPNNFSGLLHQPRDMIQNPIFQRSLLPCRTVVACIA